MSSSQKRAIKNYRSRLGERGLARFEVLGLDGDKALIREVARRLAEDGPESARIRDVVTKTISGEPPKKGGVYAWLRNSPLVGADLDLERVKGEVREIDL
ncbi:MULTISPECIES: hypothetical protein [unclassified Rhizobium]|uniref:hypothetical protein n=1 Tax=Rhizobium TaxID=379 RepID=UPI00084CD9D3|nr:MULTISPECIES: hypothetical protein [unclassified Rhizobium]MBB3570487.1 hypothetical protein [Rhizobium sp. BK491]OEC97331.1 hypothetical protein A9Z06_26815 [Rhizobium sp. YK2]QYA13960.1 hypothetical protein J5284_07065 [Rhizobium sp. AB2/73]UEQ80109.1 hypothetical protein I8E17_14935 [Rhizobium sp. AB2/73]